LIFFRLLAIPFTLLCAMVFGVGAIAIVQSFVKALAVSGPSVHRLEEALAIELNETKLERNGSHTYVVIHRDPHIILKGIAWIVVCSAFTLFLLWYLWRLIRPPWLQPQFRAADRAGGGSP
jgi:hypothetical protein